MKKFQKIMVQVGTVMLTAGASACIAMLQNYLATKGVSCDIKVDPASVAVLGASVKSAAIVATSTRII